MFGLSIPEQIYNHYQMANTDKPREHLGASVIGKECSRQIWYMFRWFKEEKPEGRILRLFETGHREEARMLNDLRGLGLKVIDVDADGKQLRAKAIHGHVGGSLDGQAFIDGDWVLIECKTHNDKSFQYLKKDGVAKHKPEHYAQMTIYMGMFGLKRGMYMAHNKDNDELYVEWVEFDKAHYDALLVKANRIVFGEKPPSKCNDNPNWYKCKFCWLRDICHEGGKPDENCRTCVHGKPTKAGEGQ